MTRWRTERFGPFRRGVVDTANAESATAGALLRVAENLVYRGDGRLVTRRGFGGPLNFWSGTALAATTFKGRFILLVWDAGTGTVSLVGAGLGQYTSAIGPLTVWGPGATKPRAISFAEGLGTLYIAAANACTAAGVTTSLPNKKFDGAAVSTWQENVGFGAENAHFNFIAAFNQHVWGVGWGGNNGAGAAAYRPELARWSGINFGAFSSIDSFTLGDRPRNEADRIITGGPAGESLVLTGGGLTARITGYGRGSWQRTIVDRGRGATGFYAYVAAGDRGYYWTRRGPMVIGEAGPPQPLDLSRLDEFIPDLANPRAVIAGYDAENGHVAFVTQPPDSAASTRLLLYDVDRALFLGPASVVGSVAHLFRADVYVDDVEPPAAAPSAFVAVRAGPTTINVSWTNTVAGTVYPTVEIREASQGKRAWRRGGIFASAATSGSLTVTSGKTYQLRIVYMTSQNPELYPLNQAGPRSAAVGPV